QRTALGRSIVRHPHVFLFDEPLSNLDASLRVEMRAELSQLHRRLNATIIYVTHDQVEAMTMGQRIAVMDEGHLQQCAEPLQVYRKPENLFVARFIGSPSINLFEGTLEATGESCTFRGRDFRLNVPCPDARAAGAVTLGVRPEDLQLSDSQATFTATARVVEPIGSEVYVHLETESASRVILRAAADTTVHVDQSVGIEIAPEKVHLFHGETGERIGP
ncbi:MAG: hypothetical protein AMS21_09570, partial [Gemmatimonas sp. SG8_38_2]